jgi:hypothetical protein
MLRAVRGRQEALGLAPLVSDGPLNFLADRVFFVLPPLCFGQLPCQNMGALDVAKMFIDTKQVFVASLDELFLQGTSEGCMRGKTRSQCTILN